jgi:hypothetical protein
MNRLALVFAALSASLAVPCLAGCAGGASADAPLKAPTLGGQLAPDGSVLEDRTLCDWKGRKDREVSETAGAGAVQPNVRRVYQVYGVGSDRRKVLVCREMDSNLDGVKDVVRRYNEEGESKEELADANYDGRIDRWIVFAKGRLAEVKVDRNRDGEPDEWKTYVEGKLIRVKRDDNFDRKPDVWEMYQRGKLVRAGVDVDHDTRVDRWDHDTEWRRKLDQSERVKEEEEARKRAQDAKALGEKAVEGEGDEGAAPPPPAGSAGGDGKDGKDAKKPGTAPKTEGSGSKPGDKAAPTAGTK